MSKIEEVRERLASISGVAGARVSAESDDIRALLDDHARLQADAMRYRVLRDYLLGEDDAYEALFAEPEPTNAAEFDAAMDVAIAKAVQP